MTSSPLLEETAAEARGYEIDAFGQIAREDDLARLGTEEARHRLARRLVAFGRALGEEMHAAMDVGVILLHHLAHGVDDLARLLRRGAIVEIDERTAMDAPCQDGEIPAYP